MDGAGSGGASGARDRAATRTATLLSTPSTTGSAANADRNTTFPDTTDGSTPRYGSRSTPSRAPAAMLVSVS